MRPIPRSDRHAVAAILAAIEKLVREHDECSYLLHAMGAVDRLAYRTDDVQKWICISLQAELSGSLARFLASVFLEWQKGAVPVWLPPNRYCLVSYGHTATELLHDLQDEIHPLIAEFIKEVAIPFAERIVNSHCHLMAEATCRIVPYVRERLAKRIEEHDLLASTLVALHDTPPDDWLEQVADRVKVLLKDSQGDCYASATRLHLSEDAPVGLQPSAETILLAEAERQERAERLLRLWDSASERERELIRRRVLDPEITNRQLSHDMGVSESCVRQWDYRLLKRLRRVSKIAN